MTQEPKGYVREEATLVETTELAPPAQANFWDTALGKTAKTALYVAVSAAIASLLSALQDNPEMFGVYAPLINVLLVAIRSLMNPQVKNY